MKAAQGKIKRFRFPIKREPNGQEATWKLEQQGSLLAVACCGAHYQHQPGKKDVVEYFSAQSRLNLLKKLARVAWDKVGHTQFVTLTYPDAAHGDAYPDRTQQRTLLFRWIEETTGRQRSILWKVEWKPRLSGPCLGEIAPHVHLCIFGCRYLDWQATATRWAQLLQCESVNVECSRTRGKGVARYTSKYCSKGEEEGGLGHASYLAAKRPGRAWGWTRQELIPWDERQEVDKLTPEQIERAGTLSGILLGKTRKEGFVVFNDDAARAAGYILEGTTIPLDTGGDA